VHNGGGTMTAVNAQSNASCTTSLSAVRPARSTACTVRGGQLAATTPTELPGVLIPTSTVVPANPTDATGFSVCEHGTYKIVTSTGCSGDLPYVLYPRGTVAPDLGTGYKYFGVPLQSVAVTQTIPMTFLENLGVRPTIKYISQYSVSGCAQKLVTDGTAQFYSSANKAAQAATVEAVIVSSVAAGQWGWNDPNSTHKLICDKSSSEGTLLAGAEWIKFWGLFFGKETEAATSHCETEARYTCNSVAASSIMAASSHLTASYAYQVPTAVFAQRSAYCSGGDGFCISTAEYKVALIQDAGATMPDLTAYASYFSGSEYFFPAANASVFHAAIQHVDVIVSETYPHHYTWAQLIGSSVYDTASAAVMPRAFANGDVYPLDATMNSGGTYGGTDWFESRIAEPDAILEDLIAVLHPGSSIASSSPSNFLRDVHNGGGTMTAVNAQSNASCTTSLSAVRPARSTSCVTRANHTLKYLTPTTCSGLSIGAYATCPALPPMPPSPPSPPSPPPLAAGTAYVSVVTFVATVSGTVSDFDQAAYKTSLAATLTGVAASDITLTVASASVLVTADISTASSATAANAAAFLTSASSTSLSSTLGVTVTSFQAPVVSTRVVYPPPSAPSPSSPSSGSSSSDGCGGGCIAGIVVGVLVVIACIAGAVVMTMRAKNKVKVVDGPSTA